MSTFVGDPRLVKFEGSIGERSFDGLRNLEVEATLGDAAQLLPRLLAVGYGLVDRLTVTDRAGMTRLRVSGGGPDGGRCRIELNDGDWIVAFSSDGLDHWCRFLTEAVLGIAAVDHLDLEDPASDDVDITFKVQSAYSIVDEAEAKRRLAL